jgi:hypothetical protein
LEFYAINKNYPEEGEDFAESRKIRADIYIDDRNLGGLPDWGVIYQMIASNSMVDPFALNREKPAFQQPKKGFLKSIFGK